MLWSECSGWYFSVKRINWWVSIRLNWKNNGNCKWYNKLYVNKNELKWMVLWRGFIGSIKIRFCRIGFDSRCRWIRCGEKGSNFCKFRFFDECFIRWCVSKRDLKGWKRRFINGWKVRIYYEVNWESRKIRISYLFKCRIDVFIELVFIIKCE